MPKEVGVRVFNVMHEILVKRARQVPDGKSTDVGKTDVKPVRAKTFR